MTHDEIQQQVSAIAARARLLREQIRAENARRADSASDIIRRIVARMEARNSDQERDRRLLEYYSERRALANRGEL